MPNQTMESYVLTTGTEFANDETATKVLDGVFHKHDDDAGTLDLYYEFLIGGDGVPVSTKYMFALHPLGQAMTAYAWNWGTTSFEQIDTLDGLGGGNPILQSADLFERHVGTGADLGKVRIRFAGTGLSATPSAATFSLDQVFVSYAVVNRSAGHADGAIWVDTNASNEDTVSFIDGVADNPVSTWAAALVLSAALGIKRFRIANDSLVTLSANSDKFTLIGEQWKLDLNGQSVVDAYIEGARDVVGVGLGSGLRLHRCTLAVSGSTTLGPFIMTECGLFGDIGINTSGGAYTLDQCYSIEDVGSAMREIDTGVAIGDVTVNVRHHSGDIEIANMGQSGIDLLVLEGGGAMVVAASCVGGTIRRTGRWAITDNSAGAVMIINDDETNALINLKQRTPPAFRGVPFPNIPFLLVRKADGRTPVTAAVGLTAEVQIDGGSYVTASNTPTEASDGMYNYDASASDMNGAKITFRFTASNGTPGEPGETFVTILTGDAP